MVSMTLTFALSDLTVVTVHALLVTMILSGLIGIYSVPIFDSLEYKIGIPVHVVITSVVVAAMMVYSGFLSLLQIFSVGFIALYLLIYAIIWLIIIYINHKTVEQVNDSLKNRRKEKHYLLHINCTKLNFMLKYSSFWNKITA